MKHETPNSKRPSPAVLSAVIAACLAPQIYAQTNQADIMGFEATSYWSASAGTLTSTNLHTQGDAAAAVNNFSYTELTSSPLSSLAGVTSELEIDVRLPANFNWGVVQLYATSPTLGYNNLWVGQASVANLAANQFHTLQIPLSSSIENALKQNYSDLVLKVGLSVPYTSSPVVVDNLRFSGQPACAESEFNLVVTVTGEFDNQTLENMKCTFHTVYPQLVARFNPNAYQTVYMEIRESEHIAYAEDDTFVFRRQWMLDHPEDTDIVVHEGMHIIQNYPPNSGTPGWLTEGIADYVRDEYGLSNAGWTLQNYVYGQHYTNGYGVVGSFLQWFNINHPGGSSPRVDQLDQLLRSGQYTDNIWIDWTGYDIDHLWHFYSVEKGALYDEEEAPLPGEQGIVVYDHANYEGYSYALDVGTYGSMDLQARAALGISSVEVPNGYKVTFYTGDNLTGDNEVYTSDNWFLSEINDQIRSVKVELLP